ncbi:MAG: glycosyltransferase family 4 protein [Candidatus Eremiobacteraeota bacterium]|nr:glycosyltransferase family 4 protein [Candidatus Eremiobacteraeota bacterium]
MRIAIVTDQCAPIYVGGHETYLWDFARRLAAAGHDVDVYTSVNQAQTIDGVRFLPIMKAVNFFRPSGFRNLRLSILWTLRLWGLIARPNRYDAVAVAAPPWIHLPLTFLLARRWKARYYVILHEALSRALFSYFQAKGTPFPRLQAWLAQRYYLLGQGLADVLISSTPSCVESLRAEGFRQPIRVAIAGQDLTPRERIDFSSDRPPEIAFTGRLIQNKRIPTLLRAVKGLAVVTNIVGDGPIAPELRAEAQREGLDNVVFHGRASEDRKREILLRSSIFVMPSYREGWSLATVEAMAHGLVPVYAYVPERYETGITSYAREGENAFAFNGSSEDLRAKLELLIADRARLRRMREAAYETAGAYQWPAMLANLEKILSET